MVFSKDELAMACTSPALAAASYPFVDLLTGNTLRCKLFPANKFIHQQVYPKPITITFSRLFSNRLIAWNSLLHYNYDRRC